MKNLYYTEFDCMDLTMIGFADDIEKARELFDIKLKENFPNCIDESMTYSIKECDRLLNGDSVLIFT